MSRLLSIGIIGATGAVGRCMLKEVLRFFPSAKIGLFARSGGRLISENGYEYKVEAFSLNAVKNFPYLLLSAGGAFAKEHADSLIKNNHIVIDNSSAYRMTKPLIVPEVNPEGVHGAPYIANPNCSTIQLVCALAPLHEAFGLKSVNVSTYQSASGAGMKGLEALSSQSDKHPPFYNNVVFAIDRFCDDGHCYEEVKMVAETRKILSLPSLPMLATTARVPVEIGHSESVSVELDKEVSVEDVHRVLDKSHIRLVTENSYESLPKVADFCGSSDVGIMRVRLPQGVQKSATVQFWCVADNLYKGAASNAVQILDLVRKGEEGRM